MLSFVPKSFYVDSVAWVNFTEFEIKIEISISVFCSAKPKVQYSFEIFILKSILPFSILLIRYLFEKKKCDIHYTIEISAETQTTENGKILCATHDIPSNICKRFCDLNQSTRIIKVNK